MTDTPDTTTDTTDTTGTTGATESEAGTAAPGRSDAVSGSSSPEAIAELAEAAGSNPNFIPNDLDRVPDKAFRDYKLDSRLVDALEAKGITHPFPIQELTLPVALQGQDIIGQARTGTGKTLGFGLPMLQQMDPEADHTQCLVVTPTRELCIQVYEELRIGEVMGITLQAVYGGVGYDEQTEALEGGVHVVVGTPGRLLDMLNRRILDLSKVKVVILDEADEMLDMGFLPDVERLLAAAGDQETRHTMLFSATMPATVVKLARRYTNNPLFMGADTVAHETAPTVDQHFFQVFRMDKPRVLARILQQPDRENVYVFCRTKSMCDRLVRELEDLGTDAIAIHGDLRQAAREKNLDKFRAGKVSVLVATEVAARGIDVDNVTHVINYDLPDDEKMYLHRIGRTARAGAKGCAITFAEHNEMGRLQMIRKAVQQTAAIPEVFSTSELLTELFNLPEETPWRSFAKQAKAESANRNPSRAKNRDDTRGTRDDRDGGRSGGRDGGSRGDSKRGDSRGDSKRGDSKRGDSSRDDSRNRDASRGGSSREDSRARDDSRASDRQRSSRDDDRSRTSERSSSERSGRDGGEPTRSSEDAPVTRTRTRSRSSGGDISRDANRDGGRDTGRDSGRDTGRDSGRDSGQGRESSRDDSRSSERTSGGARVRARGGKPVDGDGSSSRDSDRDSGRSRESSRDSGRDSGRSRERSSSRSSGGGSREGGRSRDGGASSSKREGGRDGGGRDGSGGGRDSSGGGRDGNRSSSRNDSNRDSSRGSSRGGGRGGSSNRGGSNRGGGGGNQRGNNRGSGGGGQVDLPSEVKPTKSGPDARGEGQPRLERRVEVQHLP